MTRDPSGGGRGKMETMPAVKFHDADVPYFTFPSLTQSGHLQHAFSTRLGGVSPAPFDGLNLGLTTRDDEANVQENRRRFHLSTGLPLQDHVALAHGIDVHTVSEVVPAPPAVRGLPCADAIMTDRPGVPLALFYADCCPIFILDPVRPAVALVHAGWRGTVSNAGGAAVAAMAQRYGTRPQDCVAAIASSIGPCCFETDWDVAGEVLARHPQWEDLVRKISNKWTVDLWGINARLLETAGIPAGRISVSRLCTSCRPDLFFSFRRDQRNTGRMASACMLKAR